MVIVVNKTTNFVMQISLNQPSCFPYAEVAVAVAQTHPGFAELMIARLHEVSLHVVSTTSHLFLLQGHLAAYLLWNCVLPASDAQNHLG